MDKETFFDQYLKMVWELSSYKGKPSAEYQAAFFQTELKFLLDVPEVVERLKSTMRYHEYCKKDSCHQPLNVQE